MGRHAGRRRGKPTFTLSLEAAVKLKPFINLRGLVSVLKMILGIADDDSRFPCVAEFQEFYLLKLLNSLYFNSE